MNLNLNWNQIVDKGVEELSKAIKCIEQQHLNLSWNKVGDKDVEKLSKAMVAIKNNKLLLLHLINNLIKDLIKN